MKTRQTQFTRLAALPLAAVLAALALAPGCALVKKVYEPAPKPHKQLPVPPAANPDTSQLKGSDGSIYNSQPVNLYADDKGLKQGDIVLVKVSQTNTGSKSGNTESSRDSSITASIKYLFGWEEGLNKKTKNTDGHNLIDSQSSNSYKGDASTKREDTLEATVSAIVTDVMSNGNLVIYGHQTVTLNNEASVLTVQGVVRPSDLGSDNSIDSSRIADSNIEFTGSGVITDKQHPGVGIRVFDWLWPF